MRIIERIDNYFTEQADKTSFECMECGKKFKKKMGKKTFEVKCPKCGSTDVEVD